MCDHLSWADHLPKATPYPKCQKFPSQSLSVLTSHRWSPLKRNHNHFFRITSLEFSIVFSLFWVTTWNNGLIFLLVYYPTQSTRITFRNSSARSSNFFEVAFWQPKIIKLSPDIKCSSPEKRNSLCNLTWWFERIKMGAHDIWRLNTQRTRVTIGKL